MSKKPAKEIITPNKLEVRDECVNCEQPLALDQRFCSFCGGKRIYNRLTWRNLVEDFFDRFLNIENTFIKTFIALFTKPEDVINGYLYGMRKKYIPAFNYFAIALTVAGVLAFVLKNYFLEDLVNAQKSMYGGSLDILGGEEFLRNYFSWVSEHMTLVYFSIIPFLALFSKLVFWNYKKVNLIEHLVIYLYAFSHIAMCSSIIQILIGWSPFLYNIYSFFATFIMIFYIAYVLKCVFALTLEKIILKTVLFGSIALGLLITISIGIGILIAINTIRSNNGESVLERSFKNGIEKGKNLAKQRDSLSRLQEDSLKSIDYERASSISRDSIKR